MGKHRANDCVDLAIMGLEDQRVREQLAHRAFVQSSLLTMLQEFFALEHRSVRPQHVQKGFFILAEGSSPSCHVRKQSYGVTFDLQPKEPATDRLQQLDRRSELALVVAPDGQAKLGKVDT